MVNVVWYFAIDHRGILGEVGSGSSSVFWMKLIPLLAEVRLHLFLSTLVVVVHSINDALIYAS